MRPWLVIAGLNGLFAVAAGAFGWHWLEADDGGREIFNLGVQYQMWHALALLALDRFSDGADAKIARYSGWSFTIGTVLFSGTLYAFGITGGVPVPFAAPVGGFFLIAGWAGLVKIGLGRK